jgi:hypothetical protein
MTVGDWSLERARLQSRRASFGEFTARLEGRALSKLRRPDLSATTEPVDGSRKRRARLTSALSKLTTELLLRL